MRPDLTVVREKETHRVPRIFVPEERVPRRPKTRYRIRLETAGDVEEARRADLPVYLLTDEIVSALGFPIHFPPRLIVAREWAAAVDTTFRTIVFVDRESVDSPRLEDLIVAMLLDLDPFAARALALRNSDVLRPDRLTVRVIQEKAERMATQVRLQQVAPGIPKVGNELPERSLARLDRNNVRVGLLA
jgi:hypothetical protein